MKSMSQKVVLRLFAVVLLVMASSFALTGCSDSSDPVADGDTDTEDIDDTESDASLSFPDGLDNSTYSIADDIDTNTEGVQVEVVVLNQGTFAVGTLELYQNNEKASEQELNVSGQNTFTVTLADGVNRMYAKAGEVESGRISLILTACAISFVAPVDGASLTDADDLDANTDYLQYTIVVQTSNIENGSILTLRVGPQPARTATVLDDEVTFENITIANGQDIALIASGENSFGGTCEAQIAIDVAVQVDELCSVSMVPATDTTFNAEADEDADTNGLQKTFTVSTTCNEGSEAIFTVNGTDQTAITVSGGSGDLTLTLPEDKDNSGPSFVTVRVQEQSGDGILKHGSLATPQRYFIDSVVPVITVNLTDGQRLTLLDDKDGDLTNGIQTDISGNVTEPDANQEAVLEILETSQTFSTPINAATGAFVFTDVSFTENQTYQLNFASTDTAGNKGTLSFTVQAVTELPSLELSGIGPFDAPFTQPVGINASHDEDGDTEGTQITITVQGENVDAGVEVLLRATGNPWVPRSAQTDNSGVATFEVTVEDGTYTFSATAVTPQGEISSDDVDVMVSTVKPVVSFISPKDGTVLDTDTTDVLLLVVGVMDGDLVQLTVNGGTPLETTVNADGGAKFEDVALNGGNGIENTLVAVAEDGPGNVSDPAEITVIVDTAAPVVSITAPTDGQSLSTDADPGTPGFQTAIVATVTGEADTSESGLLVTFIANNTSLETSDLTNETAQATFSLSDGPNSVTVSYMDAAGNLGTATVNFVVDTGCYNFKVAVPAPDSVFGIDDDNDGNPDNGLAIEMTLTTDTGLTRPVPANTPAHVCVNLGQPSEACFDALFTTDNEAVFANVVLTEGVQTVTAFVDKDTDSCYAQPVTYTVDFSAPTLALQSPALTDDTVYVNAEIPDADPFDPGYQAAFTFTTDAEEGQVATLSLTPAEGGTAQDYTGVVDDSGNVTINVPLTDQSSYNASTVISDTAGNTSGVIAFTISVDRLVPQIVVIPESLDIIAQNDDEDLLTEGIQVSFTVTAENGTPSTPVDLTITKVDENGIPTGDTPYTESKNINLAYRVIFEEITFRMSGYYLVEITHTDDHGNTGTYSATYQVDNDAPALNLKDKNGQTLEPGYPVSVWNTLYDVDTFTPGFQSNFSVDVTGLGDGRIVYMCSSAGRSTGQPSLGKCADGVHFIVGSTNVSAGIGFLNNVGLLDETEHVIYAEAEDAGGNYASSPRTTLFVDATPPEVSAITIPANSVDNDDNTLVLNSQEGTPDGTNLLVGVVVSVAGADGQELTLSSDAGALGTATVTNGQASFVGGDALSLPQGIHTLSASVSDANGNPNNPATVTIQVTVDSIAPAVAFANASASAIVLTSANGTPDGDNLLATIEIQISKAAGESRSLNNTVVTLGIDGQAAGEVTQTITGLTAGTTETTVTFTDFPLPQGSVVLAASAVDNSGNESAAVTQEYDVDSIGIVGAFKVPDADIVYNATDDMGTPTDSFVTRSDWEITVSGVTEQSTVRLTARNHDIGGDYVNEWNSKQVAANGDIAIGVLNIPAGVWDVRIETTDGAGNEFASAPIMVTADIDVPLVALEKTGGDLTPGSGDDLQSGGSFTAADDNDPGAAFVTSIVIVSDGDDGFDTELYINGNLVPVSNAANGTGKLSSGAVQYNNVTLLQTPSTNTIRAVVISGSGNQGEANISNVLADSQAPTVAFTAPDPAGNPSQFTMADDSSAADGFQYNVIITTTGAEDDQVATLKVYDGQGSEVAGYETTATISGNTATFVNATLPETKELPGEQIELRVELTDKAGNAATLTGNNPVLLIDNTAPAAPADMVACIGESTSDAAVVGDPAFEAASCASASLCDSPTDGNKCSRRKGLVAFRWDAPGDDGDNAAMVTGYMVRWSANAQADPCTGFDWDTAEQDDTRVLLDPLSNPGDPQYMRVRNLEVTETTGYCFGIRAVDAVGNEGDITTVGRMIPVMQAQELSTTEEAFGTAITFESDFNNDGYTDIAASAIDGNFSGKVLVRYGHPNGDDPAIADQAISGIAEGDNFGAFLTSGNFNGDQYDDLAVAAPWSVVETADKAGLVYIYYGGATGLPSTPNLTIRGAAAAWNLLGQALVALDYNNDDVDDLVIASHSPWANENAFMLLGPLPTSGTTNVSSAHVIVSGGNGFFGRGLGKGDIDGDTVDDLIISNDFSNETYILFGDDSLDPLDGTATWPVDHPLANVDSDGFLLKITSPFAAGEAFGYRVTGFDNAKAGSSGGACIYTWDSDYLSARPYYGVNFTKDSVTDSNLNIDLPGDSGAVSMWLANPHDFNGDGFGDLSLATPTALRIYWGATSGFASDAYFDIILTGTLTGMAAGGDFNRDGVADVVFATATTLVVVK